MLHNRPKLKIVIYILAGIFVVGAMAAGTAWMLNMVTQKNHDQTKILTPQQQASEQAKKNMQAANGSESNGETAAAIARYKEALKSYQAAGDKAGEEGVKLKLQYLESLPQGN